MRSGGVTRKSASSFRTALEARPQVRARDEKTLFSAPSREFRQSVFHFDGFPRARPSTLHSRDGTNATIRRVAKAVGSGREDQVVRFFGLSGASLCSFRTRDPEAPYGSRHGGGIRAHAAMQAKCLPIPFISRRRKQKNLRGREAPSTPIELAIS